MENELRTKSTMQITDFKQIFLFIAKLHTPT